MVESQPSKLLVAGSIPVSRSSLRSPRELRLASQLAVGSLRELRLASHLTVGSLRELRLASHLTVGSPRERRLGWPVRDDRRAFTDY